jgi:uncharacterized membrane protein
MTLQIALMVALVITQVLDVATTVAIIRRGGYEQNGILTRLAEILPGRWTWLVTTKAAVAALVIWRLIEVRSDEEIALWAIVGLVYVGVLLHNLTELRKVT